MTVKMVFNRGFKFKNDGYKIYKKKQRKIPKMNPVELRQLYIDDLEFMFNEYIKLEDGKTKEILRLNTNVSFTLFDKIRYDESHGFRLMLILRFRNREVGNESNLKTKYYTASHAFHCLSLCHIS